MFDLSKKTALITGASRGLGLAVAKGLLQNGATVILNGRNKSGLEKAAKEIKLDRSRIHTFSFDVTDHSAIKSALEIVSNEIGEIDILVNNAGIQHREAIATLDENDWRKILETNLTAPFLMARAVAPGMIKRQSGKIINICSITSELGRANIAPYISAKGGLKMLTKAMAVEWASENVQVNGIGPGYFVTEMNAALLEDRKFDEWVRSRTPAGRWGLPEELVGTAVFLSSEASNFVNGQVIYVDGGFLAAM